MIGVGGGISARPVDSGVVLRRIDLRGGLPTDLRAVLPRIAVDLEAAVASVRPVVDDVRRRGAAAVLDATERFDGLRPPALRVPAAWLAEALDRLDPAVRAALEEAARRCRRVSEAQRREQTTTRLGDGAVVTERWLPVARVGLYVPGGLVAYPSSVVMNVVPAQVAGVPELAVATPPQPAYGGLPHPAVLAACALLGIDEVYAAGGAQAVAMLAYGVEGCAPVDVITGPGNVWVTAAKRLLRGTVAVDAEAGPTEVAVLADDAADPAYVAADLVAQAEHDPLAACLLVTDSVELADAVDVELGKQVPVTRHRDRVEAALAGQGAVALVGDLADGVAVVDAWAAEHLEVLTRDAAAVAGQVANAGAVFVGPYAPVSLGDYLAGSNHVLPTGGSARSSGGLSVQSFLRVQHVVDYSRDALAAVAGHVAALGGAEDLAAHVEAVAVRLR
jgi:histidinol dehydrogenase